MDAIHEYRYVRITINVYSYLQIEGIYGCEVLVRFPCSGIYASFIGT